MPLVINTNVTSLNAQRFLGNNANALSKTMERLSSGFRINRAGDDAAGLQLSENLRGQIRGSKKALDNVQDGLNVLNIVDGAMQTIQNNMQRMRELIVQAANDTYAAPQRAAIVSELEQLMTDNDRIANGTLFNGVELLNDNVPANFWIQVGPNDDPAVDRIDIAPALVDFTSNSGSGGAYQTAIDQIFDGTNLISGADGVIDNNAEAQALLTDLDAAMTELNLRRGNLGALYNRLEGAATNLQIAIENLSASESRIRNVDVAAESAEMTRNQILQQSAASVLAQANQTPQLALKLLGN